MKRFRVVWLLFISFSLVACGQDNEVETPVDEQSSNETVTVQTENVTPDVIELQGFSVLIPDGYTATGGHDGVKYVNVVLTPTDPNLTYEIEVGYGIGYSSNDFEGQMYVRGYYSNTIVEPIDTTEWNTNYSAYTYIRSNGDDSSGFIDFKDEYGAGQVVELFRDGQWLQAELRVKEGDLLDYPNVLSDFMSTSIDWKE